MEQEATQISTIDAQKALIKRATEVFMRLGIRAVNMADLATELGISKKTLYRYFDDKRDLILQCMTWHCDQMESVIDMAKGDSENTIAAEMKLIRFIHNTTSQMHPSILYDLRKYHPRAFEVVNKRRDQILQGTVEHNIRRGQSEGLYRTDVLPALAAQFLLAVSNRVQSLAETPENKIPLAQLYLQSALYHIRAISTPKGLTYLEEKIKEENLIL